MGKICNPEVITRTIIKSSPQICFYKMQGELHMRLKSSLTRERVKKDPAFLLSRVSANFMALASPLASAVYARMPASDKGRGVFQRIVGVVKIKLREGMEAEEVVRVLEGMFLVVEKVAMLPLKVLPAMVRLKKSNILCVDEGGRLVSSVFTQQAYALSGAFRIVIQFLIIHNEQKYSPLNQSLI